MPEQPFTYIDLFAGIGGFHGALSALGGDCWFASEIDDAARAVYEANWGFEVAGDIKPLTEGPKVEVPPHDVLAAGFPCQPFSKSGYQRGMDETRGTLFFDICKILDEHHPPVILLENVRNLAGPRQRDTWNTIVKNLRNLGYRVSDTPAVFSPHLLPKEMGGTPQVRERVFITGTYVGSAEQAWAESDVEPIVTPKPLGDWDPLDWDLECDLPLDDDTTIADVEQYKLSKDERRWLEAWTDFIQIIDSDEKLPGFPIWADAFEHPPQIEDDTPSWKANFLRKNSDLYQRYEREIDAWFERWDDLEGFPASRRKLEWQAQDGERDLFNHVLHFRPSGIRVKRGTYLPALVAITQTSVIGERMRRITPDEAKRLQGFPDWFTFGDQPDAISYKQLGNAVSIGAAYFVFREHVLRDREDIPDHIVQAVLEAGPFPVVPKSGERGPVDSARRHAELAAS